VARAGGASLGATTTQVSGILRLTLNPIEDPPFLRRIGFSLLGRPQLDFDLRVLGGPDLMSLPSLSSWVKAAVDGAAIQHLAWPREAEVWIGPPPGAEAETEAAPLAPPLGVLWLEVQTADLAPRRSTFLGRLKNVNPRVFALLPPAEPEGGGGVLQASLTRAQVNTQTPCWQQRFLFVATSREQALRLLLSHQRIGLLGADMPLGFVEVPLDEVLPQVTPSAGCSSVASGSFDGEGKAVAGEGLSGNGTSHGAAAAVAAKETAEVEAKRQRRSAVLPRTSPLPTPFASSHRRSPPQAPTSLGDVDDGYDSASSLPFDEGSSSFLTPAASLLSEGGSPRCSGGHHHQHHHRHRHLSPGLGLLIDDEGEDDPGDRSMRRTGSVRYLENYSSMFDGHEGGITPAQGTGNLSSGRMWAPPRDLAAAAAVEALPGDVGGGPAGPARDWLAPEGVWVDVPSTSALTLAGMVEDAVAQPGRCLVHYNILCAIYFLI
jgi:hypothetical protein